jgi:hypothetical protein
MTPFGLFDTDPEFAFEIDKAADWIRKKLGEPVMAVHVENSQIYAAFEEACLEFSAVMNSYQAKSVLTTFLGAQTGTLAGSENKYPPKNLQFELQMADAYAAEADVNSQKQVYKVSVPLTGNVGSYDLQALLSGTGPLTGSNANARVRVREVFHTSPMSAYRFFGTTSGLNYLNNEFKFESFTPETLFYMLPVWEDILRGMQFKTSNKVRRSNYSFNLKNNVLTLFPTPSDSMNMWLTFTVDSDPTSNANGNPTYNGVANLSNVPFGNITFSNLNSISRHWIRRMALALSKEVEGLIRNKFSTIPIPNGDVTLNGPELIADARNEQDILRTELRDILEETTYQKLAEKEAQMTDNLQNTMKQVPMGIFIGSFLLMLSIGYY